MHRWIIKNILGSQVNIQNKKFGRSFVASLTVFELTVSRSLTGLKLYDSDLWGSDCLNYFEKDEV